MLPKLAKEPVIDRLVMDKLTPRYISSNCNGPQPTHANKAWGSQLCENLGPNPVVNTNSYHSNKPQVQRVHLIRWPCSGAEKYPIQ